MEKKILIDVEGVVGDDNNALIIRCGSGVFYSAQVGGLACHHPEVEGLVLNFGSLGTGLNDCDYGCWHLQDMPDKVKQLSEDIDKLLKEETTGWSCSLRFNFDRIKELEEGWWPVIFEGEHYSGLKGKYEGYLCTGSCD